MIQNILLSFLTLPVKADGSSVQHFSVHNRKSLLLLAPGSACTIFQCRDRHTQKSEHIGWRIWMQYVIITKALMFFWEGIPLKPSVPLFVTEIDSQPNEFMNFSCTLQKIATSFFPGQKRTFKDREWKKNHWGFFLYMHMAVKNRKTRKN